MYENMTEDPIDDLIPDVHHVRKRKRFLTSIHLLSTSFNHRSDDPVFKYLVPL